MVLSERIRALLEYSKMSIPKFSEFVGFKTPQTVREMLKGTTKTLSEAAKFKLIAAFPEVNQIWLLTGDGSMLNPRSEEKITQTAIGNGNQQSVYGDNNMLCDVQALTDKVKLLEREVADLRSQLADKERIIKLLEAKAN